MKKYIESLAKTLFQEKYTNLQEEEKRVIDSIANEDPLVANINESFHEQLSFGQILADKVSAFGGSWRFIILFVAAMTGWMVVNTVFLLKSEAFDPYPFILLNLILSTLAALQAPIIMMSQNRQAAKDRMELSQNYKVTLKTELEIIRLHHKIDSLMEQIQDKGKVNDE